MQVSIEPTSPHFDQAVSHNLTVFLDGERVENGVEMFAPEDGSEGWVDVLDMAELGRLHAEGSIRTVVPKKRLTGHVTYVIDTAGAERTRTEEMADTEEGTLEVHGEKRSGFRNRCVDCGATFHVGELVKVDPITDEARHAPSSGCHSREPREVPPPTLHLSLLRAAYEGLRNCPPEENEARMEGIRRLCSPSEWFMISAVLEHETTDAMPDWAEIEARITDAER